MKLEIDITVYTSGEVVIIIDKLENYFIEYKMTNELISILDEIDIKTFQYLTDFSKD